MVDERSRESSFRFSLIPLKSGCILYLPLLKEDLKQERPAFKLI